jgi:ABC-2 type transport system ATP-binding protein
VDNLLTVNNLSKNYGHVKALENVSLNIPQGASVGILGPNGSGKTTLLSIILKLVNADSGEYIWFGQIPNTNINHKIGVLLETPNYYPYLTILQNLKIIAMIKQIDQNMEEEIDRVLAITNMLERRNSRFDTLSYGMRQRVAFAAMLLGDPQILILDEPTNGLDPQGIAQVRELIFSEVDRGKTVIMASHILSEVERICTHVGMLRKGNLIAFGKIHDLLKAEDSILISSDNLDNLYDLMLRSGMFKTITKTQEGIILILESSYSSSDLNEYAFKNGIVLNRFEVLKRTLESQYLEIMQSTN